LTYLRHNLDNHHDVRHPDDDRWQVEAERDSQRPFLADIYVATGEVVLLEEPRHLRLGFP